MTTRSGPGSEQRLSRRQMLKAGLATAAAAAMGGSGGALTQSQAPGPDGPVIDIHAHYFPEAYLDLVAGEGKRFDASYQMTDKGFFIKTPAGNNGPLPAKFIDLKARIADMDQQGVAVQAISLTAPMVRAAAQDGAGWHGGAHSEAMTAAAEVTIVCSGV